ncbi:MAG: hypothetical protein PF694_00635 [Bacteroidetes bacterium]|jgi:FtsH-binding integral membrane protein|nr:hypothetical protein [Bacteroidota bacterium]
MNADIRRFSIRLLIASAIAAALTSIVNSQLPAEWVSPAWPYLLVFFLITNISLYGLYIKAKQKKLSSFTNFFMLATFLKLVLYLIVIVVYLLYNRADAIPFVLTFFVYYLLFTALEVFAVSKVTK